MVFKHFGTENQLKYANIKLKTLQCNLKVMVDNRVMMVNDLEKQKKKLKELDVENYKLKKLNSGLEMQLERNKRQIEDLKEENSTLLMELKACKKDLETVLKNEKQHDSVLVKNQVDKLMNENLKYKSQLGTSDYQMKILYQSPR
ncbi:hypothetical protein HELRODRAFT_166736 [Helobdella robusta]|uniref:Uncharacterized protein n=1 Tax=Helobdella robusta TaxID=6412 RepID=T1EYG3_HELRO|nr:hypothetical protein HELRODRAFT_166736 [Helobdella robusta]ESO11718.1 hypothetical protein HELRODRAFT_166736 [Helobdella robusta]